MFSLFSSNLISSKYSRSYQRTERIYIQTSNRTAPALEGLTTTAQNSSVLGVLFLFTSNHERHSSGPLHNRLRTFPTPFAQHGPAPATAPAHPSPGRAARTAPRLNPDSRTGESGAACPLQPGAAPLRSPPPAAGQRTQRPHRSGRARAEPHPRSFAPQLERGPTASPRPDREPRLIRGLPRKAAGWARGGERPGPGLAHSGGGAGTGREPGEPGGPSPSSGREARRPPVPALPGTGR